MHYNWGGLIIVPIIRFVSTCHGRISFRVSNWVSFWGGWSFPRIECMVRSANTVTITHRGSVNTYEHIRILLLKTIYLAVWDSHFPYLPVKPPRFGGWILCVWESLPKHLVILHPAHPGKKSSKNIKTQHKPSTNPTEMMVKKSCEILLKSWNHRKYLPQQLFFVPRYQAQHPFRQQHGIKTVLLQLCQRGICQVLCVLGMENSWKMMG